jgi:rhodanese-related sulfurtransferase
MKRYKDLDVSEITEYLFISAWPRGAHTEEIHARGIRLVLSMHWVRPKLLPKDDPVRVLWLPTFDTPLTPIPLRVLYHGVIEALPVIQAGGKVLVHCRAGRHRSVAMACAILIAMGYSAQEAMKLVKEKRPAADPDAGYIRRRIEKFEGYWGERRLVT